MQATVSVAGMSCEGCAQSVSKAVSAIGGQATVDLGAGKVTLDYDAGAVSLEQLKTAITDAGYDVSD